MKIAAVSVAPVFPGAVLGGSQRVLAEVVTALGESGHEVRLLCTAHAENRDGFTLGDRVRVEPSLQLRGSFPAPYEVPPHQLAATFEAVREAAAWADRVYLHADAMYFRSAIGDRPVIRALHDFLYEEALVSIFGMAADLTIVPSEYLARCIRATAGRAGALAGPLQVIPNGVSVPEYLPDPAAPPGVARRKENDLVLLFPHRPDSRKGLEQALRIAGALTESDPSHQVRLLAPRFPGATDLDEQNVGDAEMRKLAEKVAPGASLELHDWLDTGQMPGCYAFGDVTLNPGSFIESFGLVPLESIASGTPAVCARVGALRGLESVPGVSLFDYGDHKSAAELVLESVRQRERTRDGRDHIRKSYSLSAMRREYVEAITGPLPGAANARRPEADPDKLVLAPWCHVSDDRIWNDYTGQWHDWPLLMLGMSNAMPPRLYQRSQYLATRAEEDQAIAAGALIPPWE